MRIIPLSRLFFERPTLDVAQDLLGKYLLRELPTSTILVRIVDVEAYIGQEDLACHASKGRTKRTEIMYGQAGITYVYLIYGMYHCLNIVTENIDFPSAVLIRGIEAVEPVSPDQPFCPGRIDGPGRSARHLHIDRSLNGFDMTLGHTLWLEDRGEPIPKDSIQALPRIGIDYAGEWAKKPWRFCLPHAKPKVKGMSRKNNGLKMG